MILWLRQQLHYLRRWEFTYDPEICDRTIDEVIHRAVQLDARGFIWTVGGSAGRIFVEIRPGESHDAIHRRWLQVWSMVTR